MKIKVICNKEIPLHIQGSIPVRMGVGVFKGTFIGVAEIKQEKDDTYTAEITFEEKYRNIMVSSLKNVEGVILGKSIAMSKGPHRHKLSPTELEIKYASKGTDT